MAPTVLFDGVWKKFHRGERHDSLRDLLPALASALVGRRRTAALSDKEFWALENVSFDVAAGEAFGIIGPNGAGKSTTLKLLTRILRPTRGRCDVRGRIGALIEVAAGFHPDLTGRENIYLQGAVLGMRRAEIARRFGEIVEFAGIGEFVDMPVKRYSSGMNARLGFSIAAHMNPDVLIIDEVLSVGDMAFQERCVERMKQFKREGVTIVFVSHNMQAVADLCDRGLHLQRRLTKVGAASDVIQAYVRAVHQNDSFHQQGEVEILASEVLDQAGRRITDVQPGAALTLRVTYGARESISDLTLGFLLHRSADRLRVYDGNFTTAELRIDRLQAGDTFVVDFCFNAHLTRGQYDLECHVCHNPTQRFISRLCPAGLLTVHETRTAAGVADLQVRPTVRQRSVLAVGA
jgi:homopolymeric O-antigen transport system ATP-binding protein